jgi:hypothetical protein
MKAQYYVSIDEGDGDLFTYGPYALKSAKDFARIGSQHGGDRAVTRGELGPLVRIYSGGERVWPSEPKDADVLKNTERPGSFPNPGVDYSKRLVGVSPHGGLLYVQTLPSDIRYSAVWSDKGDYLGQVFDSGAKYVAIDVFGELHSSNTTEKEAAEAVVRD